MSESDNAVEPENQIEENKANSKNVLYSSIMYDIRNMNVLSSYQLYYLREMSKSKLMEIIELYNLIMRNVNEIL